MHELQVTKRIHQIVLKHAIKNDVNSVLSVNLEIGALSDLQSERCVIMAFSARACAHA